MSTFTLAEIPGFPSDYTGGTVVPREDAEESGGGRHPEHQYPAHEGALLIIVCLAFTVFAAFLLNHQNKLGPRVHSDRPFPRYPVVPKPHRHRRHRRRGARPPSHQAPEACLTPEQDIPDVEAALKSNGDDCAPLSRDRAGAREHADS